MCNIIQSIGGLMSIPWIIKNRVYSSVTCTAQAVVKEIGNVGAHFYGAGLSFITLIFSVWNRDFLYCSRRPYLQPTLSSSPVVGPHKLHNPHRIMGLHLSGIGL